MNKLSHAFLRGVVIAAIVLVPFLVAVDASATTEMFHGRGTLVTGEVDYHNGSWWADGHRVLLSCPAEDSCAMQDIGSQTWIFPTPYR